MTLEEQERRAYADGQVERAKYLAMAADCDFNFTETELLLEIEELRARVLDLEDRVLELS